MESTTTKRNEVCKFYLEGRCSRKNCIFLHEGTPKEVKQEDQFKNDFNCDICSETFSSITAYTHHTQCMQHMSRVMKATSQEIANQNLKDNQQNVPEMQGHPAQSDVKGGQETSDDNNFYCAICKIDNPSQKAYQNHCRGMIHTQKVMESEQSEGTFFNPGEMCPDPDVEIPGTLRTPQGALLKVDEHGRPVVKQSGKDNERYKCEVCSCFMTGKKAYDSHMEGQKHRKNVKNRVYGTDVKMENFSSVIKITEDTPGVARGQAVIDKFDGGPLIGLQHITEFVMKSTSLDPKYVCNMCETKCDINTVIPHVTGIKHKLHYLKEHYMNFYAIIRHTAVRKSELAGVLEGYAQDIEEEEGRQKMKVKYLDSAQLLDRNAQALMKLSGQENKEELQKERAKPAPGSVIFTRSGQLTTVTDEIYDNWDNRPREENTSVVYGRDGVLRKQEPSLGNKRPGSMIDHPMHGPGNSGKNPRLNKREPLDIFNAVEKSGTSQFPNRAQLQEELARQRMRREDQTNSFGLRTEQVGNVGRGMVADRGLPVSSPNRRSLPGHEAHGIDPEELEYVKKQLARGLDPFEDLKNDPVIRQHIQAVGAGNSNRPPLEPEANRDVDRPFLRRAPQEDINRPILGHPPNREKGIKPLLGHPPNRDTNRPFFGQPPNRDTNGPLFGQPPNRDMNKPLLGHPPNRDTNRPILGHPPNRDTNGPLFGQPPNRDMNRPILGHPPNRDTNRPLLGQPPNRDMNKPILGHPPNRDTNRPLLGHPPNRDMIKPLLGQPPNRDMIKPLFGQPPNRDIPISNINTGESQKRSSQNQIPERMSLESKMRDRYGIQELDRLLSGREPGTNHAINPRAPFSERSFTSNSYNNPTFQDSSVDMDIEEQEDDFMPNRNRASRDGLGSSGRSYDYRNEVRHVDHQDQQAQLLQRSAQVNIPGRPGSSRMVSFDGSNQFSSGAQPLFPAAATMADSAHRSQFRAPANEYGQQIRMQSEDQFRRPPLPPPRNVSPSPPLPNDPPPPQNSQSSDFSQMIGGLTQCLVNSEDEASMALQVSNALTQALIQYRLKNANSSAQ